MAKKIKKESKISDKLKLMILVTFLLFFLSSGYAIINTRLSIDGTTTIVPKCNIEIESTLSQSWTNNGEKTSMYTVSFTNYGDETLYYWNLRFNVPEGATVNANVANVTTYQNIVNLSQQEFNAVVAKNSSVNIQVTIVTTDYEFEIGEILIDHCNSFTEFPEDPDNPDNPVNPEDPDDPEESQCNIELTSTLKGSWNSGANKIYNYNINLKNNRNSAIYYWNIKALVPSDATAVAYVAIASVSNRVLNLQNQTYNGSVQPGASVDVEIQLSTSDLNYVMDQLVVDRCNGVIVVPEEPVEPDDPEEPIDPDDPEEPTDPDDPEEPKITIISKVNNSWGSYTYQYDVQIENTSDTTISSWHFEYEIPNGSSVTQAWSCNYVSSNGIATFDSYSWNGLLQPGGKTTIGIVIQSNQANYIPTFTNLTTN